MKKLSTLFVVLLVCVGCDQGTKYTAKHYLEGQGVYSFIGDTFRLGYSENTGAFLGMGSSLSEGIRTVIFSGLIAILLSAFLFYVVRSNGITKSGLIASALIIGGGFSNLIDRWVNNGAVIDFLNIGIGSVRTGIFNVADIAIMVGGFLMLWFWRNAV